MQTSFVGADVALMVLVLFIQTSLFKFGYHQINIVPNIEMIFCRGSSTRQHWCANLFAIILESLALGMCVCVSVY